MFDAYEKMNAAHLIREDSSVLTVPFPGKSFLFPSEYDARVMFAPAKSGVIPTWYEVEGDSECKSADTVTFNMFQWKDGSQYTVFVSAARSENAQKVNDLAIKGMCELCRQQNEDLSEAVLYTELGSMVFRGEMNTGGLQFWTPIKRIPLPLGPDFSINPRPIDIKAVMHIEFDSNYTFDFPIDWLGEVMGHPLYMKALAYRYYRDFIEEGHKYKLVLKHGDIEYTWEG